GNGGKAGFPGCGKTKNSVILSGAKNLSLFLFLYLDRREILRFAQNDRTRPFFRSLFHQSLVTSHQSLIRESRATDHESRPKSWFLMRIREYTPADFDALREMHAAQGFGYPFPDLESPLLVTKLVLEDDDDDAPGENSDAEGREEAHRNPPPESSASANPRRIAMAVLLRLTAETYLLHDPAAGTPRQRWQQFLALHEAARSSAAARGLDDVQAFLPPRVARAF